MPSTGKTRFALLLVLLAWLPAACGYHFPGEHLESRKAWRGTVLEVGGEGARNDPRLAHTLRENLIRRLGLDRERSGAADQATLRLNLSATERTLLLEDRSGRADQYRVVIAAQPELIGRQGAPGYPLVQGTASYYEPRSGASVQATRIRAENEALNELTDALSAVLAGDF